MMRNQRHQNGGAFENGENNNLQTEDGSGHRCLTTIKIESFLKKLIADNEYENVDDYSNRIPSAGPGKYCGWYDKLRYYLVREGIRLCPPLKIWVRISCIRSIRKRQGRCVRLLCWHQPLLLRRRYPRPSSALLPTTSLQGYEDSVSGDAFTSDHPRLLVYQHSLLPIILIGHFSSPAASNLNIMKSK